MSTQSRGARGELARKSIVIGDHIETSGNADCLRAAAEMFAWECGFADDSDQGIDIAMLARSGVPIIALENAPEAEDLFKYRPPAEPFAIVVGNERKGISRRVLRVADRVVQIPVASRRINTINVAAAAAVAVHQLTHARQRRLCACGGRGHNRPDVLFAGAGDPIELGSAVRSAACFGWSRLFVHDRRTWFAADRVTRSLARGAARRGRNPIRVLPLGGDEPFDEVCVVSTRDGEPLPRADLVRGGRRLVVIADHGAELDDDDLAGLGSRVRRVCLTVEPGRPCPFRLVASIALAEIARQSGCSLAR